MLQQTWFTQSHTQTTGIGNVRGDNAALVVECVAACFQLRVFLLYNTNVEKWLLHLAHSLLGSTTVASVASGGDR